MDINFTTGTEKKFSGACVASGAQMRLIGRKQAESYCKLMNETFKNNKFGASFRFEDQIQCGLGTLNIHIPITTDDFINTQMTLFNVNISFFLKLDVRTDLKIMLDFDKDVVTSKCDWWTLSSNVNSGMSMLKGPRIYFIRNSHYKNFTNFSFTRSSIV